MLRASGQVDSAAISRLAAERLRGLLGPDAPSMSAAESLPASSTLGEAMVSSVLHHGDLQQEFCALSDCLCAFAASEPLPTLLPSDTRPTEKLHSRSSQSMADLGVIDICSDSDDEVVLVTATMQPVRGQKHQTAFHEPQLPIT